jgi:hypothetical protein
MVVNYREAYDMFAVNGVLFNHESPRRGMQAPCPAPCSCPLPPALALPVVCG